MKTLLKVPFLKELFDVSWHGTLGFKVVHAVILQICVIVLLDTCTLWNPQKCDFCSILIPKQKWLFYLLS